jgi:hypothetical protein
VTRESALNGLSIADGTIAERVLRPDTQTTNPTVESPGKRLVESVPQ